jgi:hypothetical protein
MRTTVIFALFLLASTASAECFGAKYGWYNQTDNRVVGTNFWTQLSDCLTPPAGGSPSGDPSGPTINLDPPGGGNPVSMPEPSAIPELALSLVGLGYMAVRRNRNSQCKSTASVQNLNDRPPDDFDTGKTPGA